MLETGPNADYSGVKAPPPLILLPPLVLGLALHFVIPLPFLPTVVLQLVIGIAIMFLAGVLMISTVVTLRRANTTFSLRKGSTALVTKGPYRFSRHPSYLAASVLYLGIGVAVNALWVVLLLPIPVIVMTMTAMRKEEAYLERKFEAEYLNYKATVRRWL
ncbi:MAG: isoprenylcysteine carboxylmethyltransferase family protein [Chloroflexi bacterium]|nr:isoprenylcysteine carboxylmethyltransferase family protein [Chloroflexota bacterium]